MDGWCGVEDVTGSCSASASSADWCRVSKSTAVRADMGVTRVDGGGRQRQGWRASCAAAQMKVAAAGMEFAPAGIEVSDRGNGGRWRERGSAG